MKINWDALICTIVHRTKLNRFERWIGWIMFVIDFLTLDNISFVLFCFSRFVKFSCYFFFFLSLSFLLRLNYDWIETKSSIGQSLKILHGSRQLVVLSFYVEMFTCRWLWRMMEIYIWREWYAFWVSTCFLSCILSLREFDAGFPFFLPVKLFIFFLLFFCLAMPCHALPCLCLVTVVTTKQHKDWNMFFFIFIIHSMTNSQMQ